MARCHAYRAMCYTITAARVDPNRVNRLHCQSNYVLGDLRTQGGNAVTDATSSSAEEAEGPTLATTRMEWPDWEIPDSQTSDGTVWQLARYVDPEATEVPIGAHLRGHWDGPKAAEARAAELYGLIVDRDIQYARDPWNPSRFGYAGNHPKQRVRTPAEVVQGVGSCLDLSLLFAGMAVAASIRPFVAVTLNAPTPHALVVLDLSEPLSRDQAKREEGPEHWLDEDGHGVWRPESKSGPSVPHGVPWWELSRSGWLIIDIACAARTGVKPADEFEAACLEKLPGCSAKSGVTWTLIDVEAAMDGQERYKPPARRASYPIHSYLPELPEFRQYPTRRDLISELGATVGSGSTRRLVLQGPGGRGKSLLAQRLAWAADNGCGWFLNATDAPTLRASLAAAEQAERGQWLEEGARAELPDSAEVTQLASAALARLKAAEVPWVVVLDNCDESPSEDLRAWCPQPHRPGQIVIMTTRNEAWASEPDDWTFRLVPALRAEDLQELHLPAALMGMAEDPLVAEPLAALAARGATVPETGRHTPQELVWTLILDALGSGSHAVRLSELLAWLPPEPTDIDAAPVGTDVLRRREAAEELVRLRFLTPVARPKELRAIWLEASEAASSQPRATEVTHQTRLVQMHRMLAEVIREKKRAEGSSAVLAVLARVLTSTWGRRAFIQSADNSALARLEGSELKGVAEAAADTRIRGLAWHGLGYVRERRGPVAQSETAFLLALEELNAAANPYEVAEAKIGLARIAFQKRGFDPAELRAAQASVQAARALLAQMAGTDARQLREQGNAMYWLIERKLAGKEKDPELRFSLLSRVGNELQRSYEQRLRIIRGANADVSEPLRLEDGIGPERAYYNLAGLYLGLAKARYDNAKVWWPTASPEKRMDLLAEVEKDLAAGSKVYREVADIRARRYMRMAHPHHAACINGNAIVALHQAVLLNQPEYMVDALRWVAAAVQERWQVASFSPDVADDQIISNDDVQKSVELSVKISVEGILAANKGATEQVDKVVSEALDELTNWTSYHVQASG